jgi:cation:H+ antiporter
MPISIAFIIAGLILLVLGGECLVRGSVQLAQRLKLSTLLIGLTIVTIGTGAPELAITSYAAWMGNSNIALGNIVGSNIANVLLVLGITAIVRPMVIKRKLVLIDVPIMIIASFLIYLACLGGAIFRWEGALLCLAMGGYLVFCFWIERRQSVSTNYIKPTSKNITFDFLLIIFALGFLVIGSRVLIHGAVSLARIWGISELIIALTIISIGTSLPELFTSVIAVLRNQKDLAVGNVVGSNIFNLLGILGITALLSPHGIIVAPSAMSFDIPLMVAVTFACLPLFLIEHLISRWQGYLFCFYYVLYLSYLFVKSKHHDLLQPFNSIVLYFCLPITVITVGVIAFRKLSPRN